MSAVARTTGELLAEAVRLARENAEAGQGPFGALLARDGEVLATGVNTTVRDSDPTAHAEVAAIRNAAAPISRARRSSPAASRARCARPQRRSSASSGSSTPRRRRRPRRPASSSDAVAAEMQELLRVGGARSRSSTSPRPAPSEPFERVAAADDRRPNPVRELRVALTLEDYEQAVAFYRDALGLPVRMSWDEPEGSGTILEAGRATLELLSPDQAELIDRVEVGRRVAGPVRLALEVEDSARTAEALPRPAPSWSPRPRRRPGAT